MRDYVMLGIDQIRKTNILRVAGEYRLVDYAGFGEPPKGYYYFEVVLDERLPTGECRIVRAYAPFGMELAPDIDFIRCSPDACDTPEQAKAVLELSSNKLFNDLCR